MDSVIGDLRKKGIELRDFFMKQTSAPSVFGSIPAASIYFEDPDAHLVEILARLPADPKPELGIVSWQEWKQATRGLQ